jgi:hypothetical protein
LATSGCCPKDDHPPMGDIYGDRHKILTKQ